MKLSHIGIEFIHLYEMNDKKSDIIDITMKDATLVLSDQLLDLLAAKAGDKLSIGYIEKDENLIPIISLDEGGHKLNKNNTISFRGKQRETLTQFGSHFWAQKEGDQIILIGDGIPVFTTVKKAVTTYLTKDIIEDRNYNITKLTNYEF